jgi:Cadherin domain/Matrixin
VNEFDVSAVTDNDAAANSVNENASVGTTVGLTVFAQDLDATTNTVTYTLDSDAGGRFAVDSVTGIVTVAGAIDREAAAAYMITVRATSLDGSFSTADFTIDVNDLNDIVPVVTAGQTFSLPRISANGTVVGSVAATDGDVNPTTFQNWMVTGGNGVGVFAISGNGQLTVIATGPLQTTSSFTLFVTVADGTNTSAAQMLTINVSIQSATQQLQDTINMIQNLVAQGILTANQANPLNVKLQGAIAKLNAGNTQAGINQLNAFINQVNAYRNSGKLTQQQANQLIASVQVAIDLAAAGGGSTLLTNGTSGTATVGVPIEHEHELLIGTVGVLLTHASGHVTADHLARVQDMLDSLNTIFAQSGLTLILLDGQNQAEATVHVDIAPSSECGDAAAGILGCTWGPGEITILAGWDWYTGADTAGIGWGQYDFQSVLAHELGHAVGLNHSGDELSVMYAWLADGSTRRNLTEDDLALLGGGGGGGPLRASPRQPIRMPAVSWLRNATSNSLRDDTESWDEAIAELFNLDNTPHPSEGSPQQLMKQMARDRSSNAERLETNFSAAPQTTTHRLDAIGSDRDPLHERWQNDLDVLMSRFGD